MLIEYNSASVYDKYAVKLKILILPIDKLPSVIAMYKSAFLQILLSSRTLQRVPSTNPEYA